MTVIQIHTEPDADGGRAHRRVHRPEAGRDGRREDGRTAVGENQRLDAMANWQPAPSAGLRSDVNEYGFPTVVYRTPSRLVEECERALDAGLLLAALSLIVTVPDVCANIAGTKYLDWCKKYLNLPNASEKIAAARKEEKTENEITEGFDAITTRGIFTASDLYQLRCAVVHTGSSVIDGKGADYSPYKIIGVCIQGDARGIVASYGHTGTGGEKLENCAYDCVVKLEGLISLIAKGVRKFIDENPEWDRENSVNKGFSRSGVTDFRPLNHPPIC